MNRSKQSLRKRMRSQRQALSPSRQRWASQRACKRLSEHPIFTNSRRIALYLASDGEINPKPLLELACQQGKQCYLPKISRDRSLRFIRYRPGEALVKNRYGIAEPCRRRAAIAITQLDLIIMPLLAFDQYGGRLGMGGGFYDRSLKSLAHRRAGNRPVLMGFAYAFQQVEKLDLENWDVKLDFITSEEYLIMA